jgi:hypothetical protein
VRPRSRRRIPGLDLGAQKLVRAVPYVLLQSVLFLGQPRLGLGGEAVALFQELLFGEVFQVRAEAEVRPRPGDQDRHRDPGLPGRVAHHAGMTR